MKVISADSGAAILDSQFNPLWIVASCAVLVEQPFRVASELLAEPVYAPVEDGHKLIVHELELCQRLLKVVKADVIHLDLSIGGLLVEEISPVQLRGRSRSSILKILPKIRKLATDIKRIYGVDVAAIGKESVPVRVAELTAGAHAILFACEKALKEGKVQVLGLPSKCDLELAQNLISLRSLIGGEHDIMGFATDKEGVSRKVKTEQILNPIARGFRALKINPKPK